MLINTFDTNKIDNFVTNRCILTTSLRERPDTVLIFGFIFEIAVLLFVLAVGSYDRDSSLLRPFIVPVRCFPLGNNSPFTYQTYIIRIQMHKNVSSQFQFQCFVYK